MTQEPDMTAQPSAEPPYKLPQSLHAYRAVSAVTHFGLLLFEVILGGPYAHVAPFVEATTSDDRLIRVWPKLVPQQLWPPRLLTMTDVRALDDAMGHDPEWKFRGFAEAPKSRAP